MTWSSKSEDTVAVLARGTERHPQWRLGESPEGGALTPEQQEELARHFALKPTLVSALSKHLGDALDLNISHAYFEISRQVAE